MYKIRLGDIATLINGDRGKNYPSQADITDEGDIPFVNAGHLNGRSIDFEEMNYISQDKFNRLSSGKFVKGDVLYCLRGSLGKKAIVNDDVEGAIASSLVIIRPDYNRIDGDYLMFSLDSPSIKEQLIKANNGSSQPNLSAASVREYQIELPDMKVQKDVVNKLAKVRTIIDSRQHEIDLLDELIKARFVEMFGDPASNPKKWYETTIGEECFYIKDGPHKSLADIGQENGGHPFISVRNIVNHVIDFSTARYISDEDYEDAIKKCHPEKGDMLYSKGGTTGIAKLIDVDVEFANWVHVAVLKFHKDKLNGVFFENMLNSDYCYDQSQRLTKGIANRDLVLSAMAQIKMYRPPMELQEQFAEFVKQVDKSKVAVQKSLDETQRLFDSLMQEYFG